MKTSEPSGSRTRLTFLLIFALITAALGFVALLGWFLGLPLLASFGVGLMPMAPSTAVLFLLYGVALGWRARTLLSGRALGMGISGAAGWLGALSALLLFVLSSLGVQVPIEHFGLNITETVAGAPTGYMSPVTAFCFLLASVSFLASLSPSATRFWRAVLALGSASVLLETSFIFLLAYYFGTPLLYGGTFIPPALTTSLAFVTLGLALLALACWPVWRPVWRLSGSRGDNSGTAFGFGLIFVLLAAGILNTSYIYYRHYEKAYRAHVERELTMIAELKVSELARWRKERLGAANILFQNVYFAALVRRFLEKPEDAEAQQQLQMWAGKFKTYNQSDRVSLLDAQGDTRLSVPADLNPSCPDTLWEAFEALRLGQIRIQDFNRHESGGPVYLAVLVPIFDESDANRPLGVFVLHVNPTTYLYPLLQRWPTPSQSAETILVRREGNEAVFLNDLKFKSNAALNLRVSLENTGFSAVKAVLGQRGIMECRDYCGRLTIAAVCAVPDSPWFLVTRIDTEEVYAQLGANFWQMVVLAGVLLFGSGAGVRLVSRRQSVQFYRERARSAEALQESQARLNFALETNHTGAWDICLLDHTAHRTLIHDRIFGYETLLPSWTYEMFLEHVLIEDRPEVDRSFRAAAAAHSNWNLECRIRRADGAVRWILAVGATERNSEGKAARMLGLVQDITERKNAEEVLSRSRSAALNMMEDAIAARDQAEKSRTGLEREMEERQEAEAAVQASLREKEVLLKEIHHRVKNNLQIIISLLHMQADQENHPAVLAVLQEAQNRVLSMSLIHESLYGSQNLAQVNLAGYIETLCTHLFRSFGSEVARIKLEPRLEVVTLGLEQAVPCGMIINELVSNALKYAFPAGRAGQITLAVRAHAGQVHIRVADNGVGLPPALEVETARTLGLRLVFMLAKQLKGAVVVERDGGAAFQLTFPLHHP